MKFLVTGANGINSGEYINFVDDPRGVSHGRIYKIDCSRIIQEFNWKPIKTCNFI